MTVRSIAVIGAGTMGRSIAELAARAGFAVRIHDSAPGAADAALAAIGAALSREAERGRLSAADAAAAAARLGRAADLAHLADADLLIEAIVEDLDAKRTLFRRLERLIRPDALLATNTSSLAVTAVAAELAHPERCAGLHFFNPPTRMRVVELVRGAHTGDAAAAALREVAETLGQHVLAVGDTPGFLVNFLGRALTGEALRIYAEGIAPAAVIDAVAKGALGLRMGPFEFLDTVGLDVSARVAEEIWSAYFHEPRFRPEPLVRQRVAAGLLGRKSGRGFHDYRPEAPPAEIPLLVPGDPLPIRLEAESEDEPALRSLFPDSAFADRPEAVTVLAPFGRDLAGETARLGLDPRRTVGIDLFSGNPVTVSGTSVTETAMLAAVAGALHRPAVAVADGAGFIAQRLAAMLVLVAADAAGRGLAAPADIDAAARLALGYPEGPLALGDRLGPARIAALAARLHAATGDPRWRPVPWLAQRAALGVKLAG